MNLVSCAALTSALISTFLFPISPGQLKYCELRNLDSTHVFNKRHMFHALLLLPVICERKTRLFDVMHVKSFFAVLQTRRKIQRGLWTKSFCFWSFRNRIKDGKVGFRRTVQSVQCVHDCGAVRVPPGVHRHVLHQLPRRTRCRQTQVGWVSRNSFSTNNRHYFLDSSKLKSLCSRAHFKTWSGSSRTRLCCHGSEFFPDRCFQEFHKWHLWQVLPRSDTSWMDILHLGFHLHLSGTKILQLSLLPQAHHSELFCDFCVTPWNFRWFFWFTGWPCCAGRTASPWSRCTEVRCSCLPGLASSTWSTWSAT